MKRWLSSRTKPLLILLLLAGIAAASSPYWLWRLLPEHPLEVVILDKSVPDPSYREHKGLTWVLNQTRTFKPDGTPYREASDYAGYQPGGGRAGTVKELPDSLKEARLIYVADTYGVYQGDFDKPPGQARTEKVYGGLEKQEAEKLAKAVYDGSLLIAEFNSFASPTEVEARQTMTQLLGLTWTGWVGRYFSDLAGEEVPAWIRSQYEKQENAKWAFKGRGMIYYDEQDRILVLSGEELKSGGGVLMELTEAGGKQFRGVSRASYQYWFDVVEAEPGTEVLGEYEVPASEAGAAKLAKTGLPVKFPAVLHNGHNGGGSYYFAGDYADYSEAPSIYQTAGLDRWKAWTVRDRADSPASFYWKVYVPMMKHVLEEVRSKPRPESAKPPETVTENGITYHARTDEQYLQVYRNGQWEDLLIKGVNMGIAKPGHFPGETAISKEEYRRWFRQIGEMNANAVRVYTLHPPAFYEALLEYNETAARPLYLFHGVWINEQELVTSGDAFEAGNYETFKKDIRTLVDVVHGNADVPKMPGHAGGSYKADISKYMIGWMLGIEWDPEMVVSTNEKNKGKPQFDGTYFQTKDASPFEVWLADMMETTVRYETDNYHWQLPMSFTNWVTTDLLKHPSEPSEKEDLVAVDPNKIAAKPAQKAGYFASYHVYPYYPDFLNYEPAYTEYIDHRGEKNNYAGYLNDLRKVHSMPVLIAEFGVPGSRGMTHRNVSGWNQGFHSEKEQGEIDARLFEDIVQERMAGGLVFTWQDEWFKRTWNTMDYDNPERRPFWSNAQTNEQQFGLLSFDPGSSGMVVRLDGRPEDWNKAKLAPILIGSGKTATRFGDGYDDNRAIREVYMTSDERYVYLRLDLGGKEPLDWSRMNAMVLLDTIDGQGQHTVPNGTGLRTEAGIDFVVDLKGPENSRLWIDSYYDSFYYHYGHVLKMIPEKAYAGTKDNGIYHPIRLTLNKEMTIPGPNGGLLLPFEDYETGKLRFGNGNPASPDYDSLADVAVDAAANRIEIRLPWALLNIKDPSMKEAMGDMWAGGLGVSKLAERFRIGVVTYKPGSDGLALPGENGAKFADVLPAANGGVLPAAGMYAYTWQDWETPAFKERLKDSYTIMQRLFGTITKEGYTKR